MRNKLVQIGLLAIIVICILSLVGIPARQISTVTTTTTETMNIPQAAVANIGATYSGIRGAINFDLQESTYVIMMNFTGRGFLTLTFDPNVNLLNSAFLDVPFTNYEANVSILNHNVANISFADSQNHLTALAFSCGPCY